MSYPFIGEIRLFGFNHAPQDWAWCNGQLLPIDQNQALYAILETRFGGDGTTTFALPNLQGRVPMHHGKGPGLTNRALGESGGQEEVVLTEEHLPPHSHQPLRIARDGDAVTARPNGALPGVNRAEMYTTESGPTVQIVGVGSPGPSRPHNNMMPYLKVNFCIALDGIFPPWDG